MELEVPAANKCGSANDQNIISCKDCQLSWRLEKELSIHSLTSCFPGPTLLGDTKEADQIRLSIFVLASCSDRNPPSIAALHLENLHRPWKIGHLETWNTEYVADRDTFYNTQYIVCKILNQQDVSKIKKEPNKIKKEHCNEENYFPKTTLNKSTMTCFEEEEKKSIKNSMQANSPHLSTSQDLKLEPKPKTLSESKIEKQRNILLSKSKSDVNISSTEQQKSTIDEDVSVDIKDEPIGEIKKEVSDILRNKLVSSSSHTKERNTCSNISLKEAVSVPKPPSLTLENNVSLKEAVSVPKQPSLTLENVSKKPHCTFPKEASRHEEKDKMIDSMINKTSNKQLTTNNVNEHNLILNQHKVMKIKQELLDERDNQSGSCEVEKLPIISYNIKKEMIEEYSKKQPKGHLVQNKLVKNKHKTICENSERNSECDNVILQKEENGEIPMDFKDEPIVDSDSLSKSNKKNSCFSDGMKDSASSGKCLKNYEASHVDLEKGFIEQSNLKIETKELKEILQCIKDKNMNASGTKHTVQNDNCTVFKVKNVNNISINSMNYEEKSIKNEKEKMKNSILSNRLEMQNNIISKVSSLENCNIKNSPQTVSTKNPDISGVVTNITEKILCDINAMLLSTNVNSEMKVKNSGGLLGKNGKELENATHSTVQPICDESNLIKKEMMDKSVQNMKSNEDLTKLVLTRSKNHKDWNVLVTLDKEGNKSTDNCSQHTNPTCIAEKLNPNVSNLPNEISESLKYTKATNNNEVCLEFQDIKNIEKIFNEQVSTSIINENSDLLSLSPNEIYRNELSEISKINSDAKKLEERENEKCLKQKVIFKYNSDTIKSKVGNSQKTNIEESKPEKKLNNVKNVVDKDVGLKNTNTIEKNYQNHRKSTKRKNNSHDKKCNTRKRKIQSKKSKPTKKSKQSKKRRCRHTSSSSSNSSLSSSENYSSSSSRDSSSSSSRTGSSRSSSSSENSSRSSSTSSTRSSSRRSRFSRRVSSKSKNCKVKDHFQKKKMSRDGEDAIVISDESEDEIKIKKEKMSKGYDFASKTNALALNAVNLMVDEKTDGFYCEAQNTPDDINIITRPEYIIISKKSLGNLKVTESDNGQILVAPEKVGGNKGLDKVNSKFDKMCEGEEENTIRPSSEVIQKKSLRDISSTVHDLEEVNKDYSIQDYCNMNKSLKDVLSAKKLHEVRTKMKKRKPKLKMHEKDIEKVVNVASTNDLKDDHFIDREENPFCKLSLSSISINGLSDDNLSISGDSGSSISADNVEKSNVKRSHSRTMDKKSHRKHKIKSKEDLRQVEKLRKERMSDWISHVNDNLTEDHLIKSKKRKKEHREKSHHHHQSKHRNEKSKQKSSHNERHSQKRKKRKHDLLA
ncbi:unnamed protein product [Meganyctiphanes norvegica]|uniref:Uncharacterized protein n=1 Tax=Meganyctiphanes norvegica TaxID=48144 RepID=A0AAV2Q714_MEGNR